MTSYYGPLPCRLYIASGDWPDLVTGVRCRAHAPLLEFRDAGGGRQQDSARVRSVNWRPQCQSARYVLGDFVREIDEDRSIRW